MTLLQRFRARVGLCSFCWQPRHMAGSMAAGGRVWPLALCERHSASGLRAFRVVRGEGR